MARVFQYYNTGDDSNFTAYGANWKAQTFTPIITHDVSILRLKLWKKGSPGTTTVSIKATDDGHPTGADLTSGTISEGNLSDTTPTVETISVTAYTLTAETKYAIVVKATSGDAVNLTYWRLDLSGATYTGGNMESSSDSGSSWDSVADADFYFEEWGIVAFTRSLTTAIGLQASVETSGKNLTSWLCIASRSNGSVKTRDGTAWSSCAKDANGDLLGAHFAQYDNRLCVIRNENIGFAYSDVNDITANWTDKPNFPNLPQKFTDLFVGRDAGDNPTLRFVTPIGVYYLDVFTNFVFGPTEVGWEYDDLSGKKGMYWKGDEYIAVGKGIYKVSSGEVSLVGPDMDDGLPEDMQGAITDMIGIGFWLVIAIDGGASSKSSILKRYITGKHWHPVYVGSKNNSIKSLFWDSGTLYFGEGSDVKSLPFSNKTENVAKLSTHPYCETGDLIYPYFHSEFEAMPKVAHKVRAVTQDCTDDNKITIYYRVDEDTDWTELGSFTESPRPNALSFPASGDSVGVPFERIQLKRSHARDSTTTNSPKLESLTLEYRVVPPVLWGWDFRVQALSSGDQSGKSIINALKEAIEKGTLMSFYPDGDKSSTEYFVEVTQMPGNEAGTEFGIEGIYTVSVSEVVD